MAVHSTFRLVHRLRADEAADILRYSSRLTLALAMLDDAHPEPVPVHEFTRVFGCAPPETAGVMARLRQLRLAEPTDSLPHAYRLSPDGLEVRARIAALLATAAPSTTAA